MRQTHRQCGRRIEGFSVSEGEGGRCDRDEDRQIHTHDEGMKALS